MKTLKDVINNTLLQTGESTSHKYMLYKSYAMKVVRELMTTRTKRAVKVAELPVQANKVVIKPDDFEALVRIGFTTGDRVVSFVRDEHINRLVDSCCEDQPNPSHDSENWLDFVYSFESNINHRGEHYGRQYGNGDKQQVFTEEPSRFILSSDIYTPTVYLEYVSNGWENDEQILVDDTEAELINRYIKWQKAQDSKTSGRLMIQALRAEYYDELRYVVAHNSDLSVEDIFSVIRNSFKQSPKI